MWLLTGLWHGASWNYVLWGLWSFLFLMLERYLLKPVLKKLPAVSNLYLLLVVCLGWALFRFQNLELVKALLGRLFGVTGGVLADFEGVNQLRSNLWLLLTACVACTPLLQGVRRRIDGALPPEGAARQCWNWVFYGLIPVALLLLSTANLVGDSFNPFIYFQF